MREPLLLSLGQFMDALGIGRDDGEVQKKYDEYKLEFSKKGARPFFEEHKNDAWCVDIVKSACSTMLTNAVPGSARSITRPSWSSVVPRR